MFGHYYNYQTYIADGRWARLSFLRSWRAIYADDGWWTPPDHRTLALALRPGRVEHLDSAAPILLHVNALRHSGRRMTVAGGAGYGAPGSIFESPVAAVVLLRDPRRQDRATYLGLLHFANDDDVLDRLLGILLEELWRTGSRRIIGPTGLSPRLESGALHDHFDVTPPMDTPYNPPYVPEILDQALQPLARSRLYYAALDEAAAQPPTSPAALSPFPADRLVHDLLPLFSCAFDAAEGAPPLDQPEATFLLDWVQTWPTEFWLATMNDRPVGFLALQADLATSVRRANGGRNPLWQSWLAWRKRRPAMAGRILFGGVAESWRGHGIGRQLWQHARRRAHQQGWRSLTVGPIFDGSHAAAFVTHMGATPRQTYVTYSMDL